MPESHCAPYELLCYLNQYANLILAVVTTAYVILTWRMIVEMRRARENESEPQRAGQNITRRGVAAQNIT